MEQEDVVKARDLTSRVFHPDILAVIVEHCGQQDWASPLKLQRVSRHWKDVLDHTPRAWLFVDLHDPLGFRYRKTFFKKSRALPLHISIKDSEEFNLLSEEANRIVCLSTPYPPHKMDNIIFPALHSLQLRDAAAECYIDELARHHFPNLRRLDTTGYIEARQETNRLYTIANPLAPLESMSVGFPQRDVGAFYELLAFCKDTLVTLCVQILGDVDIEIELPRLKCLQIKSMGETARTASWSRLTAPSLVTYIQEGTNFPPLEPSAPIAKQAVYVRCECGTDFSSFPNARLLQVGGEWDEFEFFVVKELMENEALCPKLERVDMGPYYFYHDDEPTGETFYDMAPEQTAYPKKRALRMGVYRWIEALPYEMMFCNQSTPCQREWNLTF